MNDYFHKKCIKLDKIIFRLFIIVKYLLKLFYIIYNY